MLIAFVAQHGVHFLRFDLLYNSFEFLYFILKFVSLGLNGFDSFRNEDCFVLDSELFELSVLYFCLYSTAGGLQVQEVFGQLRVLIIFSERYLRCSRACIDKPSDFMAPESLENYLI